MDSNLLKIFLCGIFAFAFGYLLCFYIVGNSLDRCVINQRTLDFETGKEWSKLKDVRAYELKEIKINEKHKRSKNNQKSKN